MIYYPLPLYRQEAFMDCVSGKMELPVTEDLCNSVLSIPMHTELTPEIQERIIDIINNFK
jgi:UDP-2-acetamido-2-deoxy-ribo-hexuluronate aminotransferase